ncbi:MAG: hypothetical protein EBZ04_05955 [Betaproteobacteria bacterium]|nr:hypothetical protein [Betaproteobacteria bacterium]
MAVAVNNVALATAIAATLARLWLWCRRRWLDGEPGVGDRDGRCCAGLLLVNGGRLGREAREECDE